MLSDCNSLFFHVPLSNELEVLTPEVVSPGVFNPSSSKKWVKTNGSGIYFNLWATLHQYAKNFPSLPTDQDKQDAINFFNMFSKAIPCLNPCRAHYEKWFLDHPLRNHLSSRLELQQYVVDLHNDVNKRTNKPILSFEEAMQQQEFNNKVNFTEIARLLKQSPSTELASAPAAQTATAPNMSTVSTTYSSWWPTAGLFLLFVAAGGVLYCISRSSKRGEKKEKK